MIGFLVLGWFFVCLFFGFVLLCLGLGGDYFVCFLVFLMVCFCLFGSFVCVRFLGFVLVFIISQTRAT